MKIIIDFIVNNRETIILIAACLLDLVLFLVGVFKKRKNSTLEEVLMIIPSTINKVEQIFGNGNGEKKKSMVMEICLRWYFELTGIQLTPGCRFYNLIDSYVESVLATPTKKGN